MKKSLILKKKAVYTASYVMLGTIGDCDIKEQSDVYKEFVCLLCT